MRHRSDNRVGENKATDQPVGKSVTIGDRGIPHRKLAELMRQERRLPRRMQGLGGGQGVWLPRRMQGLGGGQGVWLSQSDMLMNRGQTLCLDPQGGLKPLLLQAQRSWQRAQRADKSLAGCNKKVNN